MTHEEKIDQAVKLLCNAAQPKKIILFGSYARGDAKHDSDLDLMVIFENKINRHAEMVRLRRILSPLRMSIDVIVVIEEKFNYWRDTIGHLYNEVSKEGKVIYEKLGLTAQHVVDEALRFASGKDIK